MNLAARTLSIVGFLAVFFLSSLTYADVIKYQQPIATDIVGRPNPASQGMGYSIPMSTGFILSSATMWMQASTSGTFRIAFDCNDGVDRCDGWSAPDIFAGNKGVVYEASALTASGGAATAFTTVASGASSTAPVSDGDTLSVTIWKVSNGMYQVYGTSTPDRCAANAGCFEYGGTPYLYLYGQSQDTPADFTRSYITSFNSPAQSEVTASTVVTIDFDYWNTGYESYDFSGVALNNLSAGQTVVVSEESIVTTGAGDFFATVNLISGDAYTVRPYLRNSTTNQRVYGSTRIFYVESNPGGQSLIPSGVDESNATSTLEGLGQGVFDSILNLFGQRFPFNWMFEIAAILQTLNDTESAGDVSIEFDFGDMASTSDPIVQEIFPEPIVFFSSTTVFSLLPEAMVTTFRALIQACMWVGFAIYAFYRAKSLFA